MVLDVSGTRLDMRFLTDSGVVGDYFTLFTEQAVPGTVGADYTCVPGTGTLPFSTSMSVTLQNLYTGTTRTIAAAIELDLASGQHYASWCTGFTNVAADSQFATSWVQSLPAVGSLVGPNTFTMRAIDVTPAPFNQPPYPPDGDMATAGCTVTGMASDPNSRRRTRANY